MLYMTKLLFGLQNFDRLIRIDPPRAVGVVLIYKTGEGFADDQADIQRLTGILLGHPAGAFQSDNMLRILEYDIPGLAVRDDLLQVFEADILLDCDQLFGSLEWHYLAMI